MKILTSLKFVSVSLLLACAGSASAQTVAWGSSHSTMPIGCLSDGAPAGETLTWCLGYFEDGFTPTAENSDEWIANFVSVDVATEKSAVAGNKQDSSVKADGVTPSNAKGKQIYVFAYNDPAKLGTPEGEALIFTQDGMYFPGKADFVTMDIARNKFDPADESFTVVWGRVDRNMEATGGLSTGGGVFHAPLVESSPSRWEAQTATWSDAAPTFDELASALGSEDPEVSLAANEDYDGDGRVNFFEHAAGTLIGQGDPGYAMIDMRKDDAVDLTLPKSRPSDVRYVLEYSETLVSDDWTELSSRKGNNGWHGASPIATLNAPSAPSSRELSSFKAPEGKRGFFRVKVEPVQP